MILHFILILSVTCLSLFASQRDILENLQKTPVRSSLLQEPIFISQAQLKYTLGPMSYHSCWTDRPLFLDPSLVPEGYQYHYKRLTIPADLKRRCEILSRYHYDSFSFFYDNLPHESEKIMDIVSETDRKIAPIVHISSKSLEKALRNALHAKGNLKIQGKPVVFIRGKYRPEIFQKPEIAVLRKHLIMLTHIEPHWPAWQHYYKGTLNQEDIEKLKRKVRDALNYADGVNWIEAGQKVDHALLVLATDFLRDVLMPVTRQVLKEPPYQNKLFGCYISVGHENAYAYGYYRASRGTETIRSCYETALANHCDYIYQGEWDEENENTSLRPTVYNSLCYMRISRYYSDMVKGHKITPMKGDDQNIPNFALSMRKILTLGERLEIQLLNIPDDRNAPDYRVHFALKDIEGNIVFQAETQTMQGNKMDCRNIFLPSEDFSSYRALLPSIDIEYKGKNLHFEKELHCVELRPQMNCDFKWVHQSFRDLITGVEAEIKEIPEREKGLKTFTVSIDSPVPFSQAELLEAHQPVISAGEESAAAREGGDHWAIRIINCGILQQQNVKGGITVKNGEMLHRIDYPVWSRVIEGNVFHNHIDIDRFSRFPHLISLIFPKNKNKNAILCFNFPGLLQKEIPLQEIIKKKNIVINGRKGISIGICRQMRQLFQPKWLNTKKCSFTVDTLPTIEPAMMHLRLIGLDGKLYYSRPVFSNMSLSGKEKILRIFSETRGVYADVRIPEEWISDANYEITDHFGALVPGGICRRQWGCRGGFIEQITFQGGGDGSYGNLPAILATDPLNIQKSIRTLDHFTPEIDKKENAWIFNGHGDHIQFTQEVIPRRNDYRLSFECKPDTMEGCQVLFDATPHFYIPVIWRIILEKGVLRMMVDDTEYSAYFKLKPGQWHQVIITHCRNKKIIFTVDGTTRAIPCEERAQHSIAPLTLGGRPPQNWFKGRIRNLKISYGKQD